MKKKSYIGYLIVPILLGILFLLSDNTRFQQNCLRPALCSLLQKQGLDIYADSLRWHWINTEVELYQVSCRDSSGQVFADAGRLDINLRLMPLLWRQLHIQSIHLDAFHVQISPDLAFSFAPKKKKANPLRIKIDQMLITQSSGSYDSGQTHQPALFDFNHIDIRDLQAKISLLFTQDFQRINIADLAFEHANGFVLQQLQLQASLDESSLLRIPQFRLQLPSSYIVSDSIELLCPSFSLDSIMLMKDINVEAQLSTEDFPSMAKAIQEAGLSQLCANLQILQAQGDAQYLQIGQCLLSTDQDLVAMDGRVDIRSLNPSSMRMQTKWEDLSVHPDLLAYYDALFPEQELSLPEDLLHNLGQTSFSGDFVWDPANISLDGFFSTSPGRFRVVASCHQQQPASYDAHAFIDIPSYHLDELLDNEDFRGETSLRVKAEAKALGTKQAALNLEAKLRSFPYLDHLYQQVDIMAKADLENYYQVSLNAHDDACNLEADFQWDRRTGVSDWKAQVLANHINLQEMNILEGEEEMAHLSFQMDAHLTGDTLERLWGDIQFDSIDFFHHNTSYFLPSVLLSNRQSGDYAHLQLLSDQISADFYGDMNWSQLVTELQSNVLAVYLPSVFTKPMPKTQLDLANQFSFRLNLNSTDSLAKAFSWPVSVVHTANIEGYYYDEKDAFALSVITDSLRLQDYVLTNTHLMIDNKAAQRMDLSLSSTYPSADEHFYLQLESSAQNDSLKMDIQVDLDDKKPFAKSLSVHHFGRDSMQSLQCHSLLNVPYIQWKDALWSLDTTAIDYRDAKCYVSDFAFHNNEQFLNMDGVISKADTDTLLLKVSQLNLAHITQLFPPKKIVPKPMRFGGLITADASLRALLSTPEIDADLRVKDFSMNQAVMGDLDANARWNNAESCLEIESTVNNGDMHVGMIDGAYHITKDSLCLHIDAEGIPLNFISYYLDPMINLSARVHGNVSVIGAPVRNRWDVIASAYVPDGEIYSPFTNTRYSFSDSIFLTPGVMHFNQIDLYDEFNNHALFNGRIAHSSFNDLRFDLSLDMQNLHLMDLPMSDLPFYGEVEASGRARMSGSESDLRLDIDVQTEDHTNFYLSLANSASTENNYSFIEFVDHESKDKSSASALDKQKKQPAKPEAPMPTNLSLDVNLEITPTANLIFVTNQASGDEMRMSGSGTLRLSYDNNDDLQLFGRYELDKGKYGFTFQDLIHRDFNILQGSSINFAGDLMSANLDINANYSVLNVELSDILDEAELNSMNLNRTSIPVNCQLNILGELQQPEIVLGLDFPAADEELRRRIMNIINTDEVLNRQIVSLLLLNRFATTENVQSSADAANNNMSAVMDIGLNSLSNQLNRMIYQAMGSDNLSFDLNYRYDDMAEGLGEWQVAMSSQFLNNRLSINGNIGSREDLVNDNTQFIGDFDAEYKFSRDGRLRGKFFNRTNDSRYFKSAMTTQGVGIVYKESFHSFSELRRKIQSWIAKRITRSKADSDIKTTKQRDKK